MRRSLLLAVLSLSLLLRTLVAAQDASYTFTTLNVPGATRTLASEATSYASRWGRWYEWGK